MAISDELTRIQTAKADIKASIEAKGVTIPSDALIDQYADYVDQIQTGGGGGNEDLIDLIERDLKSINIPNGTTKIGDYAFSNCTSLTSITIPDSVTSIGFGAFNGCDSLPVENYIRYADTVAVELTDKTQTAYTLKTGTRLINDSLFYGCRDIANINIPNGVISIGQYAFYYCSGLTSVTIPDTVTNIDAGAFGACTNLTSINIPNGVTSINNEVFASCESLTSITIPDGVTSIGNSVFRRCTSLTSVTIGNSVTSIGAATFSYCTGLTSVTIPNSVTNIGLNAFNNCTSLKNVTIEATTPPTLANANAFTNTNKCPIYVPAESVDAYKTTTNWSTYASRIHPIP